MRFQLSVVLSHLRSRRAEAGISVITLVSIIGVVVGVTALIMVLAVMEGFEVDLRNKILGYNAHLIVLTGAPFGDYDKVVKTVESVDGIVAAAPFVYNEAMIRSNWGTAGVVLKGIDPTRSPKVTDVAKTLIAGPEGPLDDSPARLALLDHLHAPPKAIAQNDDEELPGIAIGRQLADQLKVYVGDKVAVINPVGNGIGPMGMPVPYVKPFRVAGIFYTGMYEYDNTWAYVTIEDAQRFLKIGDTVSGIEARVADIYGVRATTRKVQDKLGFPFTVRNWMDLNKSLFHALRLEKIVMGLILSLIVLVASLNIVGTLILVVLTRTREVAILRAMGASSGAIRGIFVWEGVIIGGVGTALGTVLGLMGCWTLSRYPYRLDTDVYYVDTLPVVVEPATVVLVVVGALLICFTATLYPATVAARIQPVEGLRYE